MGKTQIYYRGRRAPDPHSPNERTVRAFVSVTTSGASHDLTPRHDLYNHSPDGFEWGYHGSGPAQLALAMCAHALGDDKKALKVYQRFKDHFVARLPRELVVWKISVNDVLDIIREL